MIWKSWRRWQHRITRTKTPDRSSALRTDCLGYSRSSGRGECQLVVGFDFGTSASKIVVQAPYLPGRPVFIAHRAFCPDSEPNWLWPSRLSVDASGVCSLKGLPGSYVARHLKIGLMDDARTEEVGAVGEEPCSLAAAYFALTLRAARQWILESQVDLLSSFETIQWSLNVGIPSGSTVDECQQRRFRCAVDAGWRMSLTHEPIRVKDAALECRAGEQRPQEEARPCGVLRQMAQKTISTITRSRPRQRQNHLPVQIGLCPEVLAGAMGYAMGDERRDGLHLAIDVGASTVDACMFLLREADGDEQWPLLEAEVDQLGTVELHRRRVKAVEEVDAAKAKLLKDCYDPLDPMAIDPPVDYSSTPEHIVRRKADDKMSADLRQLVGGIIQETAVRRDRHAPAFRLGGSLPILLMGGGSRSAFYRRFAEGWHAVLRERFATGQQGAVVMDTPIPRALDRDTLDAGHRLAVAFGLSHPYDDLPRHKPPTAIADIPPPEDPKPRGHFVDKDQV